MPRPKSSDKRSAVLAAAIRAIVSQGLSAPTAGIAKDAGVANGSLFTYFATKTELFNQLYLELKHEMSSAALDGLPEGADLRNQMFHVWRNWTHWALSSPDKRQALSQLSVSSDITAANRAAGHKMMAGLAELVEHSRAEGAMRKAPLGFVLSIMTAVAEATMDFMTQDPANAKKRCKEGFEALWRMLG